MFESLHFETSSWQLSPGVMWSREEALSTVLAAEAVDLPADGNNINYHDHLSPHAGQF